MRNLSLLCDPSYGEEIGYFLKLIKKLLFNWLIGEWCWWISWEDIHEPCCSEGGEAYSRVDGGCWFENVSFRPFFDRRLSFGAAEWCWFVWFPGGWTIWATFMVGLRGGIRLLRLCWLVLIWWWFCLFIFFILKQKTLTIIALYIDADSFSFVFKIGYRCWCWNVWWVIRHNLSDVCIKSFEEHRDVGKTKASCWGQWIILYHFLVCLLRFAQNRSYNPFTEIRKEVTIEVKVMLIQNSDLDADSVE